MKTNLEKELKIAREAARHAGEIILGYFKGNYEVTAKTRDEYVTTADLAADQAIREIICPRFPNDAWLSA